MDPAIRLLRELVAVNSVNPTLVPGAPGERDVAELVAAEMRRSGLDVSVEPVADGRPNVVGVLDQIAGIMFVLGAAWLVWIRPGRMTWDFFAYAIQFNPGQAFQFYAWLQQWPVALLASGQSSTMK